MNNAVLFDGQTVVPKRCHRSVCQAPSVANGCANDGSDAKGSAGADGCDLGQPVCESTRVGCVWLAVASITWQCLMSYFHAFIQTNSMIWDLNLECINEPKPTCLCCCLFGRDPTNWTRQIHLCNLPHIVWCRSVSTIFRDSLQRSSGQQTATARSLRSRWYLSPWVDGLENGALRSWENDQRWLVWLLFLHCLCHYMSTWFISWGYVSGHHKHKVQKAPTLGLQIDV